jgi:hypothetical protein
MTRHRASDGPHASAGRLGRRARFPAVVPVAGLALAFLVLAGLALAAGHALSTVPVALAAGAAALAAAWASHRYLATADPDGRPPAARPGPFAVGAVAAGGIVFAAAAVVAVHYSAVSAAADADRASSPAVWGYPAGGHLDVGAQQPPGRGPASLQIVVTHAGSTAAAWNDIHLRPGQKWQAPVALAGNGPTLIIARRGGIVIARLSIEPHRP